LRTRDVVAGSAQLLFSSVTREKLRRIAPDLLVRPAVGTFASLDYFKIDAILAAAEPAKQDMKNKMRQMLGDAG
jgi:NTE family protein